MNEQVLAIMTDKHRRANAELSAIWESLTTDDLKELVTAAGPLAEAEDALPLFKWLFSEPMARLLPDEEVEGFRPWGYHTWELRASMVACSEFRLRFAERSRIRQLLSAMCDLMLADLEERETTCPGCMK